MVEIDKEEQQNLSSQGKKGQNKKKAEKSNNQEMKPPYVEHLNKLGGQIVSHTQRPLLVMYYCDVDGSIYDPDVPLLFRRLATELSGGIDELNVLIHTRGGQPNSAYMLIQTIRKFAKKVNFLIPQHSYSGGTLMALGSNKIIMGPYASLGPIDLQLLGGLFPLLSIQKYVEFVKHTRDSLTECGDSFCPSHKISFKELGESLILELTKEFSPSSIGQFFNLRKLSEYYAKVLLNDYMFRNDEGRKKKVDAVVNRLNNDYPSHDFDIDFHLAEGLGLKVELMEPKLFTLTDNFIKLCVQCKSEGEICGFMPRDKLEDKQDDFRMPYFKVFNLKITGDKNGK